MSDIAWSKLNMSGSDAAALKAVGERMMPFSSKIQAFGDQRSTGCSLVQDIMGVGGLGVINGVLGRSDC
jgi:hypothetical protein